MNKEMCMDILRHRKEEVWRKSPKNGEPKTGFSFASVPAHQSGLVKDFLAKNNVTTLEEPPYYPDLSPAFFTCSLD